MYLEQYPELISQLPISELWALDPWERLMLLIRCTENAAIIKRTLEGNDIWATTMPILESAIQQKAAELCPWETLTASQKRYMSLKSPKSLQPCESLRQACYPQRGKMFK